jgi:hypothetical protein
MGCICTSLVVDSYGTVALLNAVRCTLGLNCQFTAYPNLLLQAKKKADAEKAKADAEKVRIDAEARERKAQADTAARAALQRVEAEQKAKQEAQRKASASTGQAKQPVEKTTTSGSRPRVAPTAAKLEEARKQKLQELQEVFKPLQANPANQKVSFQLYHNVDLILALQHSEYINIDLPSG